MRYLFVTETGKVRACLLRKKWPELYRKGLLSTTNRKHIFEILLLKTKPITVRIIYRPPNQNNFLQTLNENFAKLDTLKKELYTLVDFNINLFQNQYHTGCKNNNIVSATASNDVKSYLQFCTMFGLTQIVKSPTRITCSSTSLIDLTLASLPDRISQEGVMNVGLSDHQFIIALVKLVEFKLEVCTKKSNSDHLRITWLMLIFFWRRLIFQTTNILKMLIGHIQTFLKN